MDFTIITPSLNYGRFLSECLESVAAQGSVTLEHLVIDGGSTDESAEVAARFAHATWLCEKDCGMSDAINKGFDIARGDWVMWLNADDKLKPGILLVVGEILRKSAGDVVYGNFDFVDHSGAFRKRMFVPHWSRFVHIHHGCYVPSTACFVRRRTVLRAGFRLNPRFRYVMDGEFYARLDQAGFAFCKCNLNIADFRIHGDNLSLKHPSGRASIDAALSAELQHAESRAIRRAYGFTLFVDPYLNGLVDGLLWILAKAWKGVMKLGVARVTSA